MEKNTNSYPQSEIDLLVPEYRKSLEKKSKKPVVTQTELLVRKEKAKALEKVAKEEESIARQEADRLLPLLNPVSAMKFYTGKKEMPTPSIEAEQKKINAAIATPQLVQKFFEANYGLTKEKYAQLNEEQAEELLKEVQEGMESGVFQFIGVDKQGTAMVRERFKKYIMGLLYKAMKNYYNPDGSIPKDADPNVHFGQNLKERIAYRYAPFDTLLTENMNRKKEKDQLDSTYAW